LHRPHRLRRRDFLVAALGAAGLAVPRARAQGYPAAGRTLRLVVPFAPGGGVDVLARLYAEAFKDRYGLTAVVENRGGANGSLGGQIVHQAAPDGYTLLFSASTHTMARQVMRNAPYDPVAEFTPIARVGEAPMIVIMATERPQKTIAEVIAAAKKEPDRWVFGASSVGSMGYLATVAFNQIAGLNLTITAYRGTAPALTDVIAGHIPTMFIPISEALPQARAGSIRMLAVSSSTRSAEAPDVLTIAEQGYPGFHMVSWTGMMAPTGTPQEIIDRMSAELGRALKDPSFVEHMQKAGAEPAADASPAEFSAFVGKEISLWGEAVKTAGVTLQ